MFKKLTRKFRAESLVETLIAVFIIGTGATAALALIVSSFRTAQNVENRVIAINLAREGVEAVRSIRDSNWIKYGGERREHWNCIGDESCSDKITEDKKYIVDFDSDSLRWVLYPVGTAELNISDGEDVSDENFILYAKEYGSNKGTLYTHDKKDDKACLNEPPTCKLTPFFREVSFDYVGLDGKQNVLEVKVKVAWWEGQTTQDVELVTYITDFLGRTPNTKE